MKRRVVVIAHPDFDPDTKEAVEFAADFCKGMKEVGKAMIPTMIDDIEKNSGEIDREHAERIAYGFQYKVMKVDF